MPHPILITGAAGGPQGSTGRLVANILLKQGISVRAFVHKLDARSDELRLQGAEVIEGDLLNPASVLAAMKEVKRAFFTYPVDDGLLEAATIFAAAARDRGLELVVNNSQFQGTPEDPTFRDLQHAPSFRNLQHRLADRIFDWAQVGAVHLQAPPYYENVRALVSRSAAEQNTAFLPWGDETTVIPLAGAEDISRVAAALLANPDVPSQNVYPIVSETPTVREIVEILGKSIGRPIRYVPITDEQWAEAVKERINAHALDHLTHLWQYFRKTEERYRTTDTVRVITSRKPQTLEEFFRANAESFGSAASVAQPDVRTVPAVPSVAIPKTTEVLVIQTAKQGVNPQQIMATMPEEIRATVKLYFDGKIRQWYSRGDGKGVVFLVDAKTADEARAVMETLPLAKEHLLDDQYIPVGPLMPLKALMGAVAPTR
ncbi:MAG TPA: NmrA family NAD(P)-binding protein [Bryobacteraceae bacterium]|jgi:uncharacterized protein YbjT (DUF2867 family)